MRIGEIIQRNRIKGIIVIIFITLLFSGAILINGIKYELEEESFLPKNEVVETNERIIKEYTNEYAVPILVKSKNGNVLQKNDLIEMLKVERQICENFSVESLSIADIISSLLLSLNNITDMSYENKIRAINDAGDEITQIFDFPFFPKDYISLLLSEDFDGEKAEASVIKVPLNGSLIKNREEALKSEEKIDEICKKNSFYTDKSVMGTRIISEKIMKGNSKSLSFILPFSFILIITVLLFVYKNIKDVIISLLSLSIAIIWMVGLGSILNYIFNPLITSIPVLLVGLGIDYGIHLKKRISQLGNVKKGIDSVSIALFLSAFTTSIAFLSNFSSSIPSLKNFGILSSFGVISCLIIMLFFMSTYSSKQKNKNIVLYKISKIVGKRKKTIISLTVLITVAMLYFSTTIETEFDIMDFLPEKMDITHEIEYLLKNFEAVQGEEATILIKGDIANPSVFKKIQEIEKNVRDDKYVVKADISTISIASLMRDYAERSFYDIRYNESFSQLYKKFFDEENLKENVTEKDILLLYDFLYTNFPQDAKRVIKKNDGYEECIIRISTNTGKKERNISILYNELKNDLGNNTGIITGGLISSYVILKEFRSSQLKSLFITIIISFIILEIVFLKRIKSFLIGFISLLPVILSAIWIIGSMALLGIPLTLTTITVASLAVGLGIDYSIHITHRFLEEGISSISSTGSAILGSALTTISAFGLLSFSLLPPLKIFGISIAIAITYSYISCVFILPVLLEAWRSSDFFN
ncbi:MAG TPA: hypothetical protein ENI33_07700 [Thermoplasmatales archaeon]|nr:hypothetical protein [Thermoplasmatales archaeon]